MNLIAGLPVVGSSVTLNTSERVNLRPLDNGQRFLRLGAVWLASAVLLGVGTMQSGGSPLLLASLCAALVGLAILGRCIRRYGKASLGGITWAMMAGLFVGRWYLPPAASDLMTPLATSYYDRDGAFMVSALMILVFAVAYFVGGRGRIRPFEQLNDAVRKPEVETPGTSIVLMVGAFSLILVRLATGHFLDIGVPGRQASSVPLVGVIYYGSSYGPLAGACLILWFGRARRGSALASVIVLMSDVLVEAILGSHGTAFEALVIFGGTLAIIGNPWRPTTVQAISAGLVIVGVITGALLASFVAREALNGGGRQTVGDVPAFIANRLGGLEYAAPVIGAVDRTGSSLGRLRTSSWNRYVTTEVYGFPADAHTGFATTAVGWWYGLAKLPGVVGGAALSGLAASRFDRWSRRWRDKKQRASSILVVGVWLGWATFLLGGTIGSLGGISIGFGTTAVALLVIHRVGIAAGGH